MHILIKQCCMAKKTKKLLTSAWAFSESRSFCWGGSCLQVGGCWPSRVAAAGWLWPFPKIGQQWSLSHRRTPPFTDFTQRPINTVWSHLYEVTNSQIHRDRQNGGSRGLRGGKLVIFKGGRLPVLQEERVLEMDGGGACTVMWMFLMPLNWMLRDS